MILSIVLLAFGASIAKSGAVVPLSLLQSISHPTAPMPRMQEIVNGYFLRYQRPSCRQIAVERLTNQSSSLTVKHWPPLPLKAVIHTDPEGCVLSVICLGNRAGTDTETAHVLQAIRQQGHLLEEQQSHGIERATDFDMLVTDVILALDTRLKNSLYISLAIESLEILHLWVKVYGSRDISTIISCEGGAVALLEIKFMNQGPDTTGCLLPLNQTSSR